MQPGTTAANLFDPTSTEQSDLSPGQQSGLGFAPLPAPAQQPGPPPAQQSDPTPTEQSGLIPAQQSPPSPAQQLGLSPALPLAPAPPSVASAQGPAPGVHPSLPAALCVLIHIILSFYMCPTFGSSWPS